MTFRTTVWALAFAGLTLTSAAALAADGVVEKIDAAQQKITIKHGPLDNLGMPAMTMVFKAADPAMMALVKVGQKIKFEADRVNGQITVTKIEKAK
ncbi:Copper binding protein CusF [Rhizobiales bacterium GAS113]|nr:Copper binding protein CusF [Rhizobiales bacterium GAS113]